jgi:hypothetical protein
MGKSVMCNSYMVADRGCRCEAKLVGDGWLSWLEMGGQVGWRWVAELVGDGWLS